VNRQTGTKIAEHENASSVETPADLPTVPETAQHS